MEEPAARRQSPLPLVRIALAAFVLAWLFGPPELRSAVPIWVAFLIALGLEAHYFLGARRAAPARRPDRGVQAVDRDRYGYPGDADELLLVREGGEELWIPYSGESDEEVAALVAAARERVGDEEAAPVEAVEAPPLIALRQALVGLGVIAALAVLVWFVDSRTGWRALDADARTAASARFSAEASRVAAKPVTIRCDESGGYVGAVQDADGVASVGGDVAYLTPERCLDLYRLAFEGEVTPSQTGRALAVLTHEAWHLRGVADEGTTECYALQSGVSVGRRLGLSEDTARQLMRQQLAENALHNRGSPEYLVPPDCRDGGRLDLHPGDGAFP